MHLASGFYDVAGFKAGRSTLKPVELEELADVRGRTMLHLQCHFGLDTLSWAREGAIVTGADFSEPAIAAARELARECEIDARFVVSDVYDLPDALEGTFDIVFASYGVVFWLPDVSPWARVIAHFLRPGGTFYMVELHPFAGVFEHDAGSGDLRVGSVPYFPSGEPLRFEDDGSYADRDAKLEHRVTYSWPHPVSEVVTALIDAGLRLEFLHEFPFAVEESLPLCARQPDGTFRLTKHDGSVPFLYSIRATKE